MRVNLDYLRNLLTLFLDADTAHICLSDVSDGGIRVESADIKNHLDDEFLFHFQLLVENRLISNRSLQCGSLELMGIKFGHAGHVVLIDVDLRLTQSGHDFANALENKEIFTRIKSELRDAPFKAIFDGSQVLLQHFFKNKLDKLLAEGGSDLA